MESILNLANTVSINLKYKMLAINIYSHPFKMDF